MKKYLGNFESDCKVTEIPDSKSISPVVIHTIHRNKTIQKKKVRCNTELFLKSDSNNPFNFLWSLHFDTASYKLFVKISTGDFNLLHPQR